MGRAIQEEDEKEKKDVECFQCRELRLYKECLNIDEKNTNLNWKGSVFVTYHACALGEFFNDFSSLMQSVPY